MIEYIIKELKDNPLKTIAAVVVAIGTLLVSIHGASPHLIYNELTNVVNNLSIPNNLGTAPAPIIDSHAESWQKTFRGSGNGSASSVQQTSDGGYIIAGFTNSSDLGRGDAWLIKTDSSGNKLWDKTFGDWGGPGVRSIFAKSVQQTNDGGYIIAGGRGLIITVGSAFLMGYDDNWLIKTDSSGNKLWDKTFRGGTSIRQAFLVQQTNDGGYIIAGGTFSSDSNGIDAWLIKTDSSGNMLWDRTFGGSGYGNPSSIRQTSDGGYIVAGNTDDAGDYSAWLVKTDSSGNKEWNRTLDEWTMEEANSVQQTSDGGYIIAGDNTKSSGAGGDDAWLIKTDSSGNKLWDKTFGGSDYAGATSVQQTSDGGYIIARSGNGAWLIKTDSSGNKLWDRTFGRGEANSVQQTSDGGYIIAGETHSSGAGDYDAWLIKTDANGN